MIWGIVALILLIVIIALVIWLLIRQSNSCPAKAGLGGTCSTNTDCNGGLVCNNNVCKVASGGVCSVSADCANGQSCVNSICTTPLGTGGQACPCATGFTCVSNVCRAIVGQPCSVNSDCSTGFCVNNICMPFGMTGNSGSTGLFTSCWDNNSCYSRSQPDSSCYTRSDHSYPTYSDSSNSYPNSHRRNSRNSSDSSDTSNSSRRNSSYDCSRRNSSDTTDTSNTTDNSNTSYTSYTSSNTSSRRKSDSNISCQRNKKCKRRLSDNADYQRRRCKNTDSECFLDRDCNNSDNSSNYSSNNSSNNSSNYSRRNSDESCERENDESSIHSGLTDNCSDHDRDLRRGVYVTNQNNQDQQLFTGIDQPIIDIARSSNNFVLLLADGNLAMSNGSTTNIWVTNKKMKRIVRFGNQIIGLDRDGKLYAQNTNTNNNPANTWNWVRLNNYPSDVIFMSNTNSPYNNLQVLTCRNKAYVYTFSNNWQDGNAVHIYKTNKFRYFGRDLTRYIDINEETNVGVTNDGQKYKHVKGAGFYNDNSIVPVLTEDTFTHVRMIDNNAYFLFEQHC